MHHQSVRGVAQGARVAVPARGAGCIVSMFDDFDIDYNQLPSPRGVRVASIWECWLGFYL